MVIQNFFEEYDKCLLPTTRERIIILGVNGFTMKIKCEDGKTREVIDTSSQVGTNIFGFKYSPLINELKKIYSSESTFPLILAGQDFYAEIQKDLAMKFTEIYPSNLKLGDLKVYYCNSGSEAVERGCLKAAALHKRGNVFIAFFGAFHGRTALALSANFSKGEHTAGYNFLTRILPAPYAYCARCRFNTTPEKCSLDCIDYVKELIIREGAENINGIIVEPIQGEGGYIVPHKDFLKGLRELSDTFNIPLIVDEVQTCFRTGKWFAVENFGVSPDMISVAKGFSGGIVPFGASLIKDEFATKKLAKQSNTFGGSPNLCFVALKTIELIEKNNFLENAKKQGDLLMKKFNALQDLAIVRVVNGLGLMIGIEIQDPKTFKPNAKLRDLVIKRLLEEHNIYAMACGNPLINTTIRILLPINIPTKLTEKVADGFIEAITYVNKRGNNLC
jgi:4-aminobutyrate aminotransferase